MSSTKNTANIGTEYMRCPELVWHTTNHELVLSGAIYFREIHKIGSSTNCTSSRLGFEWIVYMINMNLINQNSTLFSNP